MCLQQKVPLFFVSMLLFISFIKLNMPERTHAPNSLPDQPVERTISPFQRNPQQNKYVIPLSSYRPSK
jgi:hypothetical protein